MLEIDDVACAVIGSNVRVQRCEGVLGRDFGQVSVFGEVGDVVEQVQV